MINTVKKKLDAITNETTSYQVTLVDSDIILSVPLDPANRHYAEIMRQVEAGTLTIEEAD